ncbi:flavoprotein [Marvinbryantia formatexigens]|nr:flavoprotein [Marvinbryantia formatexigens]UWO25400.1 hypothetical protein NQ534_02600 [Marvinbryantia formatexigens DSM 14469]SDG73717.1 phosphopantothenoylcysteine decarboxylase / phosphopantothenate--cysteine ligase [Marvinbryantia formatexigens]
MDSKKKMLIGVCGSVGAVSLVNYISSLFQYYDIDLILTPNSTNFVQYKGFSTIINNCYTEEFDNIKPLHISLAANADVFLLLPASANTISKMAHGIADNLLTSTLLAYEKPVYIAANMNPKMWNNSIFQDNVTYLKKKGHIFINERGVAIEVSTGKEVYCDACMPTIQNLKNVLGLK